MLTRTHFKTKCRANVKYWICLKQIWIIRLNYYSHYYYCEDYRHTSISDHIAKLRHHQVVCYLLGQRCYYHDIIQSLWTSPDSTFRMIISLSIKIVFYISATIFSHKSSFSNIFFSFFSISLIPPPKTLITSSTTLTLNPDLLSFILNASWNWFFFPFSIYILCSCRHEIWHIQMVFVCFSSSIRSGLLDVVFRKLNSNSHTRFAWEFSKTCHLFPLSQYHFTVRSNRFCSFAQAAPIAIHSLSRLSCLHLLFFTQSALFCFELWFHSSVLSLT